jgi:DNA-binding helix-hairpin-helix protein with protein kinase domain
LNIEFVVLIVGLVSFWAALHFAVLQWKEDLEHRRRVEAASDKAMYRLGQLRGQNITYVTAARILNLYSNEVITQSRAIELLRELAKGEDTQKYSTRLLSAT